MPKSQSQCTTWRNAARDTRGSEIAESAMILPMLFVAVIAIFWFGQAFRIYGAATHAARLGARAAVAPVCATCSTINSPAQNAVNAVNSALSAAHLNPNQVQLPSPVPALCPCGSTTSSCTPVACTTVAGSNVCVQPKVQLSYNIASGVTGGAGTCGTSVSFGYRYPVQFNLPCWTYPNPCTPINLQNLKLPAQAQMRMETQ